MRHKSIFAKIVGWISQKITIQTRSICPWVRLMDQQQKNNLWKDIPIECLLKKYIYLIEKMNSALNKLKEPLITTFCQRINLMKLRSWHPFPQKYPMIIFCMMKISHRIAQKIICFNFLIHQGQIIVVFSWNKHC